MADQAPITKVTLYSDRATVTRRAAVSAPGRHRLRIGPVTPLLDPRQITLGAQDGVSIESVQVERRRREAEPDASAAAASDERLRALETQLRGASERVARCEAALVAARADAAPSMAKDPLGWLEILGSLAAAATAARQDEARMRAALAAEERAADAIVSALDEARSGPAVTEGWLVLSVLAERAGAVELSYQVPCAAWRPAHRATLEAGQLVWQVSVACWNATGEDWVDVALQCSTARPADRPFAPVLVDDVLSPRVRAQAELPEAPVLAIAREPHVAWVEEALAPDDGGEPVVLEVPAATVRSTGRAHAFEVRRWEAQVTPAWTMVPERGIGAVLRARAVNPGPDALLAGPVELVRDGEHVGRGRIGRVPPGEVVAVGFGTHDDLYVTRHRDHHVDRPTLNGPQRHSFLVELRVAHLGHEPAEIDVRERIPVTDLDELWVSARGGPPSVESGTTDDGAYQWTLPLHPGEIRTLSLEYTLDADSQVRLPF